MSGDHLERLKARFAESTHPLFTDVDFFDLRALLAEAEHLRSTRTSLDGQVFVAGWYARAEACASLGWDTREAAWRKYREEMTDTLTNAVPLQPEGGDHD